MLRIGIDGGGTSTTCRLVDGGGAVLGRGFAGPSNIRAIGPEPAKAAIDRAIASAFEDAGLDRQSVAIACLGLAGFDRLEEKQWLEAWSTELNWADRLVLVNDGDLVVAAGTPEGWGVGVISGTGSIAVGRSSDGKLARSGGWGYLFGDEGSGYAVALAGLRKVARRADGRDLVDRDDVLTRLICERLGIGGPSELVGALYRADFDRARIAGLAPAVVEAAHADRSIVTEILEPAGVELAKMVLAVAAKLGIGPGLLPLAKAGSFLLNCEVVGEALKSRLITEGYDVEVSTVPEPVVGAVILASRALEP
jgi:N-acetylglucosamine kinase-like BadF-type ATPase